MAALPDFGIDPQSQDPMEMPEDYQARGYADPASVDPGSPPADPMLQQEPDYEHAGGEVEYREQVELCGLAAMEACAKAVEAGIGAQNPDFAAKFAQAYQALGLGYESLTRSEQAEKKNAAPGPSSNV